MKLIIILLMVCGEPDRVLVISKTEQSYYKVKELNQRPQLLIRLMRQLENSDMRVAYEDEGLCT